MVGQSPMSSSDVLLSMNAAGEEKKRYAMKTLWLGGIVCVVGLVSTFILENFMPSSFEDSLNYELLVGFVETVFCCGGPLVVLAGVAMLISQGMGDKYVSIIPVDTPPKDPR
jgi:Na+-driven multidrug efflux pump